MAKILLKGAPGHGSRGDEQPNEIIRPARARYNGDNEQGALQGQGQVRGQVQSQSRGQGQGPLPCQPSDSGLKVPGIGHRTLRIHHDETPPRRRGRFT
jgi:hypothetical protein